MIGWTRELLGNLVRIKHGYAFKGEFFTDSGKYVLLTPGSVYPNGGLKLKGDREKFYSGKFPEDFLLKKGDLITVMTDLTQDASILGAAFVIDRDDIYLHNQRLGLVKIIGDLDPRFLYYYFNWQYFRDQVKSSSNGATVKHTAPERIYKCSISLPDFETQRKISAILTAYDDLIETNQCSIAHLEKMAEEIYREWFVRMRFPGYQKTKFFKGVPEGWDITQLGQIANMIMGQSPKSEFYNDSGQGLPFHQGVGTYGDRFPRNITFCTADGRKAKKGDILFSVRAPVGRLNIANCELIIGRGIAAIRQKEGKNSYLYYLLRTMFANEDIIGNGSIFNSVGKDELSRFIVLRHPDHLTARFEKIALPIDQQIEALLHSNSVLTKTRDLLLPRLISGKLSVADLDIQFPPSMSEDGKEQGQVS